MSAAAMARQPVRDLDIEQWVHERYGFVPHPFWISHCRELYLKNIAPPEPRRQPWHECPVNERLKIKEAFAYFGLLPK